MKCCLNEVPSSKVLPTLDRQTKIRYQQRQAEWAIPASDRVYCSKQPCSAWIPPQNINGMTRTAKCPLCKHNTCTICRGDFHQRNDCPQDTGLQATFDLAEIEGWKRCYSCSALVEHNKGCRHMTCRCKAQFCYICGLKWKTCPCTEEQLAQVQLDVIRRRRDIQAQRTVQEEATAREAARAARAAAREADEAAENQQILEEVENFIRLETEREQRAAEAERRRTEAERRQREEEHVARVHAKFEALTTEMGILHQVQTLLMTDRHEKEVAKAEKETIDFLKALTNRHAAQEEALLDETAKLITTAEASLTAEYEKKRTEEARIEKNYLAELRGFWQGPDAENQIRTAIEELRGNCARDRRFWEGEERAKLRALGDRAGERLKEMKERQAGEVRLFERGETEKERNWEGKRGAEVRWREEVFGERVMLLGEAEVVEYGDF